MTSFENLTGLQKCRAALNRDVQAICQETCHHIGLDITKSAMELVTELVSKKLLVYGSDLEAFAKHAKRTSINMEDVKLLARRCPSLKSHLTKLAPSPPSSKEKKRKSKPAVPQETIPKEPEIQTSVISEDKNMEDEQEILDCVDLTLN